MYREDVIEHIVTLAQWGEVIPLHILVRADELGIITEELIESVQETN